MRELNLIDKLRKDLRYAVRQLQKNPGFTATSLFILAAGVCASVAIFTFVDAAFIKPLPYGNPDRLVGVFESNGMFRRSNLSYADYLDWKRLNRVFRSLDIYQGVGFTIRTASGAEPARGARVSDGFFRTLGVHPILGRDFYEGEDRPSAPRVALLSYGAWQRRYGGRVDVLGRVVTLEGTAHLIVGVLPRDFHFAPAGRAEFWTAFHASGGCDLNRRCHGVFGVARLRDGVALQAALANVETIARQLERRHPDSNRNQGAELAPLSEVITGDIRPILLVLLDGAGLLLLIAAVNVAGLLLVRSEHRKREIALRTALGASSLRLIGQFVTEALVLTTGAGGLGLAAAYWAVHLLRRLIPADMLAHMAFLDGLSLNRRVVAMAAAMSLAATVLLSVPPVLHIRSLKLRSGLAEAGRGFAGTTWRRVGSKLVVLELAMAIVLLVGAGLLGKSLYHLLHVDLGMRPDHLVTLEVVAPKSAYGKDVPAIALERQIADRVGDLPGVDSVGVVVNGVPVTSNGNTTWFLVTGRPWHGEHYDAPQRYVSPGYFATLGAKLFRGRDFTEADDESKPRVAIVNRTLARRHFPGEDALGKQISIL